ncbi:MAG: hypothetical protein [Cressdnaviricota sp.]|nr:MAG: hypothetical protein [Cressdnaviricota sp.]
MLNATRATFGITVLPLGWFVSETWSPAVPAKGFARKNGNMFCEPYFCVTAWLFLAVVLEYPSTLTCLRALPTVETFGANAVNVLSELKYFRVCSFLIAFSTIFFVCFFSILLRPPRGFFATRVRTLLVPGRSGPENFLGLAIYILCLDFILK